MLYVGSLRIRESAMTMGSGVFGGLGMVRKVSVAMRCGWRGRRLVKMCQRLEYGFAVCLSCVERKKTGKKMIWTCVDAWKW